MDNLRDYVTTASETTLPLHFSLDKDYSIDDLAQETVTEMLADIDKFWDMVIDADLEDALYPHDDDEIMHDFWLTRNRHGAGFWDGDYEDTLGERLTEISETFGKVTLYVGDDGLIYQFAG